MIIIDLTRNLYTFVKNCTQIKFMYTHSKLVGSLGLGLILNGWQKLLANTHEMEINIKGKISGVRYC